MRIDRRVGLFSRKPVRVGGARNLRAGAGLGLAFAAALAFWRRLNGSPKAGPGDPGASEAGLNRLVHEVKEYAIYGLDLEGRVVSWNAGAERAKGYRAWEIIGSHFSRFYTVEDQRDGLPAHALEVARLTGRFAAQGWQVRKDGSRFWAEVSIEPITDSGHVVGFTKITRDITDRKNQEDALRDSEAGYRLLADHSTDVILRFGPDGAILYASPSAALWGYDPAELQGRLAWEFTHPDDRAYAAAKLRNLFAGGPADHAIRREYRIRRKDGGYVWMEGNPSLITDEQARPIEVVSVFRDVTARHVMEDSLADAKAEAEAATGVKSELLANMTHELRTPLTSIIGFSELLEHSAALAGDDLRYLTRATDASKVLLTLVNDILDFSKLEAGYVEIEPRPIDPSVLGVAALGLMEPQATRKGLTLGFEPVDLPDRVLADDARLTQILLNFISNAVKFTAVGGVTLRGLYRAAESRLRYEVIDTGVGVPPAEMERLFKRFSQVDGSTARSFGGTGLGLAICKGLAEAMGGDVGATSVPGQGSTFWVEIPSPIAAQSAPEEALSSGALEWLDALDGMRLLIVDDDPANRDLIRIIASPFGVIVSEADTGADAVRLARLEPFDVILMALRAAEIDGPAAAGLIRGQAGPNADCPIIAFTAEPLQADRARTWAGLFHDVCPKPIMATDLLSLLARWSAAPQARDAWPSAARG